MSMHVTDFEWLDERFTNSKEPWKNAEGKWINRVGYYMDEYLAKNLMGVPAYLKKAWDVVGIVSGHGKVRIGKSTLALQIAYFLAWMLAGGKMGQDEKKEKWIVEKKPDKPVRFGMENIVFSPEELMKKASELFKKYGKNQVIVYDEGRAGLDSARAMQAINKVMQDFFQECGQYGHIIIIVLPSFFKLHEDYATSRSLFLVDVYADNNLRRGFFNFYTERQKEYLYLMGKKRVGTLSKYYGCHHSFSGRFTPFLPVPKEEYDKAKARALKKKELTRTDRKWKQQRDAALYLIRRETEMTYERMAREMTVICGFPISKKMMSLAVSSITKQKEDDKD